MAHQNFEINLPLKRQKKTAEAHLKYETGQETTKHPTTLTPVLPLSSRHT